MGCSVSAGSHTTSSVVGKPTAGHAHIQVFGAGGPIDDQDGLVDGDALGFVDRDRIGQGHVAGHIVGGQR